MEIAEKKNKIKHHILSLNERLKKLMSFSLIYPKIGGAHCRLNFLTPDAFPSEVQKQY